MEQSCFLRLMSTLSGETTLPFSFLLPFSGGSTLNPIAPRKSKIVYNFGLFECHRDKGKNFLLMSKFLP